MGITKEQLKQIMYGKIDWIKVFKDAYLSRKTSWWEVGHINEWRNATDESIVRQGIRFGAYPKKALST